MTANEAKFLLPVMASGGCSRFAIHGQFGAVRSEGTNVAYAESPFTSRLRPVLLTRKAPPFCQSRLKKDNLELSELAIAK
jgi:hypothetical protein